MNMSLDEREKFERWFFNFWEKVTGGIAISIRYGQVNTDDLDKMTAMVFNVAAEAWEAALEQRAKDNMGIK